MSRFNITLPHVILLLTIFAFPTAGNYAQPVHPHISLTQPSPQTLLPLNELQTHPPRIALFKSEDEESTPAHRQAVQQWEYFLLGLSLPYQIVHERDLARLSVSVLILPDASNLSSKSIKHIISFVARGGGLIASGETGVYNREGKRNTRNLLFATVFQAQLHALPLDTLRGILHSLPGGHPVTAGLSPPGFRLNIETPSPFTVAIPLTPSPEVKALGRPHAYSPPLDSLFPPHATLILYGSYKQGRFLWTRFNPQDVSRQDDHQYIYQGFMLHALAYTAGLPILSIAPWPHGFQSAASLVGISLPDASPSLQVTALAHLQEVVQQHALPVTLFITAKQKHLLATNTSSLIDWEIAGDEYLPFIHEPLDIQRNRLQKTLQTLTPLLSSRPEGFHPPDNLYDGYTLWAMQDESLRYLFASSTRAQAPSPAQWLDDIDWQEKIPPSRLHPEEQVHDIPRTTPDDMYYLQQKGLYFDPQQQLATYKKDFTSIHTSAGLYVLLFHPEVQTLFYKNAQILGQLGAYIRQQKSWLTSLRTLRKWWFARSTVHLTPLSLSSTHIEIRLSTQQTLPEGITLEVYPGKLNVPPLSDPFLPVRSIANRYQILLPESGTGNTYYLRLYWPETSR